MPDCVQGMSAATNLVNDCLLALCAAGCTVWRNNTGKLPDPKTGRWVVFGLCKGSSDIIGICPDGRFLAVECKSGTGALSPEQRNFIAVVNQRGGRAGVARTVGDALQIAGQP